MFGLAALALSFLTLTSASAVQKRQNVNEQLEATINFPAFSGNGTVGTTVTGDFQFFFSIDGITVDINLVFSLAARKRQAASFSYGIFTGIASAGCANVGTLSAGGDLSGRHGLLTNPTATSYLDTVISFDATSITYIGGKVLVISSTTGIIACANIPAAVAPVVSSSSSSSMVPSTTSSSAVATASSSSSSSMTSSSATASSSSSSSMTSSSAVATASNITTVNVNVDVNVNINVNVDITLGVCPVCPALTTAVYQCIFVPQSTTITTFNNFYVCPTSGFYTITCPHTVQPGQTTVVKGISSMPFSQAALSTTTVTCPTCPGSSTVFVFPTSISIPTSSTIQAVTVISIQGTAVSTTAAATQTVIATAPANAAPANAANTASVNAAPANAANTASANAAPANAANTASANAAPANAANTAPANAAPANAANTAPANAAPANAANTAPANAAKTAPANAAAATVAATAGVTVSQVAATKATIAQVAANVASRGQVAGLLAIVAGAVALL